MELVLTGVTSGGAELVRFHDAGKRSRIRVPLVSNERATLQIRLRPYQKNGNCFGTFLDLAVPAGGAARP